ncbi:DUF6147 family protein [Muricomes intestini]|jgi:hypothetical protein|uniref:Uncharacterized protein n=1 Tax=Muricomes intestini TaxID=1796634 RepID=A0A4V6NYW4_9FIRM|nr:DUF6147 family protein [Muricomes intestini]TCS79452.1 hypothetical protein EDD59_10833 [Muricomes intestini]
MKRKIPSILCTLAVIFGMFATSLMDVRASGYNDDIQVDGSYLTTEDKSTGSTSGGISPQGVYLMDGECSVTNAGVGKVYVYAATTGNTDLDYLSVVMYVDQYDEKEGNWGQVYFEQAEAYDTYYVATSKQLKVDRGYYYRVRASHVGGMDDAQPYDETFSVTNGIYIK